MIRTIGLCLFSTILFLMNCTMGTGSEVEGFAISGRAIFDDKNPVVGAAVRVRPDGFLALERSRWEISDTVTEYNGKFFIDTLPFGSYIVEINYHQKYGALQKFEIAADDSFPIPLPTVVLIPTGIITGRINLPISDDTIRPWVGLYNVDHLIEIPFTQEFSFEGVPEGVYSLRIVPYRESKLVVELHDVEVVADSAVDVGILNFTLQEFFNGCTSYECDSIAIRALLDSNGLSETEVATVISRDQSTGRVTELNLSGLSLTTITKDIGSLSALRMLDLHGNRINELPMEMGYLNNLGKCNLDSNELHDLPVEIAYLDSLRELSVRSNQLFRIHYRLLNGSIIKLDLSDNELEELPNLMWSTSDLRFLYLDDNAISFFPVLLQQLDFTEISINGNRICSVDDRSSEWLDSFNDAWRESQKCSGATSE